MARFFALALAALALTQVQGQFTIDDTTYSHVWKSMTAMLIPRSDMTATTVADAIYIIGGCSGDQTYTSAWGGMYSCTAVTGKTHKYTPADDSHAEMTDAPVVRYRHAAAAVGSRIFLFGGRDQSDAIIKQVDVFDTLSNTWSTLSKEMPNATSDLSAFEYDGKIYILGGYNADYSVASDQMMIYDPVNEAFTASYPLTQGRGDAAAAIADGVAFALGGFHHTNWSYPMDHLEVFHASNPDGWKQREAMTVARGDKAVAVLHDKLHVIGGETKNSAGHSTPLMDVEVYDAGADKWYHGGDIRDYRFRFVAASHGDSIYIFGGQGALMGSYNEAGSKYPVLDVVDRYKETLTVGVNSAASAGFKAVLMMLGVLSFA